MPIKNEPGLAFVLTLFAVVILITLCCVFVLRPVNKNRIVFRDVKSSIGGMITHQFRAFETFNGTTGENLSGYGREFVYDERMAEGADSLYFPTLDIYTTFSTDIADKFV